MIKKTEKNVEEDKLKIIVAAVPSRFTYKCFIVTCFLTLLVFLTFTLVFFVILQPNTFASDPIQGRSKMSFPEFSNKGDVEILAKSQNNFARDLYLALIKAKSGENLFFSPFSISTAVAMAHMGTAGKTEDEVKKVFYFPDDKKSLQRAFHDMLKDFKQESSEYELRTSNMAYISHQLPVIEKFVSAIEKAFLSSTKTVDFGDGENVRSEINSIVEKETNSKIKDLIPQGLLNSLTRMVLVNAVYFKGLWEHKFEPKATQDKPFWISAQQSVDIPMMTIEEDFRIKDIPELDATMLSMDYKGNRLSFVILLPNKRDGLAAMEQKLSSVDFASLDKGASKHKVKVTMPKFKLEATLDLVDTLKMMGISDLFSETVCDLSGITESKDIFVSNIIHKSFIDVNEEGSEAAAATVIAMNRMMMINRNRPFVADHPFVFYIKDNASTATIFAGRYIRPV